MPEDSAARAYPPNENRRDGFARKSVGHRIQPHSIDAEQALLACCILEGGQQNVGVCVQEKIREDSFYKPAHRIIYQVLLELFEEQKGIDEIVLADRLRTKNQLDEIGGHAYIIEVTNRIDTPVHLIHYIETVRDTATLRKLISTCTHTVEQAYEEEQDIPRFLDDLEKNIFDLSRDRIAETATPLEKTVDEAINLINHMLHHKGDVTGVPTGFVDLDKLTTGWHSGEMIVLAARPSMGKTAIALNMAEACILPRGGHAPTPTMMFSLEMPSEQLAMRLICSHARADMMALREGFAKGKEKDIIESAKALKQAPFWIDDTSGLNILELRAKARRLHSQVEGGLGLIIIDYLQLVSGTDMRVQREQQIAEISRGIKGLAKELRVPVVVLAQLNRESEKEKRQPRMSDLRESGSIEQDADVVLLLSRPKETNDEEDRTDFNPVRELIVAKQRNGPVGTVSLTFNKRITRFENYSPTTA